MLSELIFATRNRAKVGELADLARPVGIRVFPLDEIAPEAPEVDETGATFHANAWLKALSAVRATGRPCLADDSGLCVDALGGAPGVLSARFSGSGATDASNNAALLAALEAVPDTLRTAHYACVLVIAAPATLLPMHDAERFGPAIGGVHAIASEGVVAGCMTRTPRGSAGFGYDPYFLVPSLNRTFAEVDATTKHVLSHRGQAMRALFTRLARAGLLQNAR